MHVGNNSASSANSVSSVSLPAVNSAPEANSRRTIKHLMKEVQTQADPSKAITQLMTLCLTPGKLGAQAQNALMQLYGSRSTSPEAFEAIGRQALEHFRPDGEMPFTLLMLARHHAQSLQPQPAQTISDIERQCERALPESMTKNASIQEVLSLSRLPSVPEMATQMSGVDETLNAARFIFNSNIEGLADWLREFVMKWEDRNDARPKMMLVQQAHQEGMMCLLAARKSSDAEPDLFLVMPAQGNEKTPVDPLIDAAASLVTAGKLKVIEARVSDFPSGASGAFISVLIRNLHNVRAQHPRREMGAILEGLMASWKKRTPEQQVATVFSTRCDMLVKAAAAESLYLEKHTPSPRAEPPAANVQPQFNAMNLYNFEEADENEVDHQP